MKNIIVCCLLLFSIVQLTAQPWPNHVCPPTIPGETIKVPPGGVLPTGCGMSSPIEGERVVYWLHGLGGTGAGWTTVGTAYETEKNIASRYPFFPGTGIEQAAATVHGDMTALDSYCAAKEIDRSKNILVAHSLGGLVGRALDRRIVNVYGEDERRFGGMVSWGAPHQGAQILNNVEFQGSDAPAMLNRFAKEGCVALTNGPVEEFIQSVEDALSNLISTKAKVLTWLARNQITQCIFY